MPDVRLVVVPDRALARLPFPALRNPVSGRYLIEDHPISSSLGLGFYAESGLPSPVPASTSLQALVAGDPDLVAGRFRRKYPGWGAVDLLFCTSRRPISEGPSGSASSCRENEDPAKRLALGGQLVGPGWGRPSVSRLSGASGAPAALPPDWQNAVRRELGRLLSLAEQAPRALSRVWQAPEKLLVEGPLTLNSLTLSVYGLVQEATFGFLLSMEGRDLGVLELRQCNGMGPLHFASMGFAMGDRRTGDRFAAAIRAAISRLEPAEAPGALLANGSLGGVSSEGSGDQNGGDLPPYELFRIPHLYETALVEVDPNRESLLPRSEAATLPLGGDFKSLFGKDFEIRPWGDYLARLAAFENEVRELHGFA